jgi:anti-sigma28 factor (negative regulator of flagellin synthesis)
MSIRIQNDNLAGAAPPAARPADEASYSPGSQLGGTGYTSRGSDRVEISSLSHSINAAGAAQDAQQAHRVNQLAKLYRSGQYNVDSNRISSAIVSQALSGLASGSI